MQRIRAWLLNLLIGDVYVLMDCGECVGVRTSVQGAELLRIEHAQGMAALAGGSDEFNARVERMVYNRQRIENHDLGDV